MSIRRCVVGALVASLSISTAEAQSNVRPVARVAAPLTLGVSASLSRAAADPLAQHARLDNEALAPLERDVVDVELFGRFQPTADIDGGGELATQRGGWSAGLARELDGRRILAVALESEATFFDFGGAGQLTPGSNDPFNDLYRTSLGSTLYAPFSDKSSLFVGGEFTLAGEDTSDLGASLIVAAASGVRYQASRDLDLTLGISASQRLEDDAWVIPFLGIDWRLADAWRLVAEGERVRLAWEPSHKVELSVHAAYEQRQYRLNDSNPLPRGVFRDEQIDLGAAIAWRPSDGVELRIGAGYTPWRELTFLDAEGNGTEREMANSPYGEVALRLSF